MSDYLPSCKRFRCPRCGRHGFAYVDLDGAPRNHCVACAAFSGGPKIHTHEGELTPAEKSLEKFAAAA